MTPTDVVLSSFQDELTKIAGEMQGHTRTGRRPMHVDTLLHREAESDLTPSSVTDPAVKTSAWKAPPPGFPKPPGAGATVATAVPKAGAAASAVGKAATKGLSLKELAARFAKLKTSAAADLAKGALKSKATRLGGTMAAGAIAYEGVRRAEHDRRLGRQMRMQQGY